MNTENLQPNTLLHSTMESFPTRVAQAKELLMVSAEVETDVIQAHLRPTQVLQDSQGKEINLDHLEVSPLQEHLPIIYQVLGAAEDKTVFQEFVARLLHETWLELRALTKKSPHLVVDLDLASFLQALQQLKGAAARVAPQQLDRHRLTFTVNATGESTGSLAIDLEALKPFAVEKLPKRETLIEDADAVLVITSGGGGDILSCAHVIEILKQQGIGILGALSTRETYDSHKNQRTFTNARQVTTIEGAQVYQIEENTTVSAMGNRFVEGKLLKHVDYPIMMSLDHDEVSAKQGIEAFVRDRLMAAWDEGEQAYIFNGKRIKNIKILMVDTGGDVTIAQAEEGRADKSTSDSDQYRLKAALEVVENMGKNFNGMQFEVEQLILATGLDVGDNLQHVLSESDADRYELSEPEIDDIINRINKVLEPNMSRTQSALRLALALEGVSDEQIEYVTTNIDTEKILSAGNPWNPFVVSDLHAMRNVVRIGGKQLLRALGLV